MKKHSEGLIFKTQPGGGYSQDYLRASNVYNFGRGALH